MLLLGCGKNRTPWEALDAGELTHLSASETSRGKGIARFVFEVEEAHDALLLTADAEAPHGVFVRSLTDPDGEVVFDANALSEEQPEHSLTGAQFADTLAHLNWPILAEHPPLAPGRWVAEVGPLDEDFFLTSGVEVQGDLVLKSDADFTEGTLHAMVVYAGGAEEDAELVRGTEGAVLVWAGLYAAYGIDVQPEFTTYAGPITDSTGGADAEAYREIAASVPTGTLVLVVLPDFANWNNVYGLSGGIPGALVPTGRSAVAVSGFVNSGPDLQFTNAEIRVYGETIAHEFGHYLGAFHPVEQNWSSWDAVSDTPECTEETDCVGRLGENLMFPFPLCNLTSCMPQPELSAGQQAVLHRYTGVR